MVRKLAKIVAAVLITVVLLLVGAFADRAYCHLFDDWIDGWHR